MLHYIGCTGLFISNTNFSEIPKECGLRNQGMQAVTCVTRDRSHFSLGHGPSQQHSFCLTTVFRFPLRHFPSATSCKSQHYQEQKGSTLLHGLHSGLIQAPVWRSHSAPHAFAALIKPSVHPPLPVPPDTLCGTDYRSTRLFRTLGLGTGSLISRGGNEGWCIGW